MAQSRGVLPPIDDVAAPGSEVITPVDEMATDDADDVVADDVVADNVVAAKVAADNVAGDNDAADVVAADDDAADVVAADDVPAPDSEEPDVAAPCREGRVDDGAAGADRGGEVVHVLIVELVTGDNIQEWCM